MGRKDRKKERSERWNFSYDIWPNSPTLKHYLSHTLFILWNEIYNVNWLAFYSYSARDTYYDIIFICIVSCSWKYFQGAECIQWRHEKGNEFLMVSSQGRKGIYKSAEEMYGLKHSTTWWSSLKACVLCIKWLNYPFP